MNQYDVALLCVAAIFIAVLLGLQLILRHLISVDSRITPIEGSLTVKSLDSPGNPESIGAGAGGSDEGAEDDVVLWLLNALGFGRFRMDDGSLPESAGPPVDVMLSNFQRNFGLDPTGEPDEATRRALSGMIGLPHAQEAWRSADDEMRVRVSAVLGLPEDSE